MSNQKLVEFIKEARKRGFDDFQIREPLIKKGWPAREVDKAFNSLKPRKKEPNHKNENKITVYVDDDILKAIEKRAKKNMFTLDEQIEDILRRSCVNLKKQNASGAEKLDDALIGLFSRKSCGRPRKG